LVFPRWIIEPKWLLYRRYKSHLRLERWKQREQEARRKRRRIKREKLQKERERKKIKARKNNPSVIINSGGSDVSASETNSENSHDEAESSKEDLSNVGVIHQDTAETDVKNGSYVNKGCDHNEADAALTNKTVASKEVSGHLDDPGESDKLQNGKASTKITNDKESSNGNAIHNGTNGHLHYKKNKQGKRSSNSVVRPTSIEASGTEPEEIGDTRKPTADEKKKDRYKLGRRLQGDFIYIILIYACICI
jgi:beta-galactosidase/beta-glucuronidase